MFPKPDLDLPLVYVVSGYMVYEEHPNYIHQNGMCILANQVGILTYYPIGRWTYTKGRAIALAMSELERQKDIGYFNRDEAGPRRYEWIKDMYSRHQVFIRPGWSQKDLVWGDPAPISGE